MQHRGGMRRDCVYAVNAIYLTDGNKKQAVCVYTKRKCSMENLLGGFYDTHIRSRWDNSLLQTSSVGAVASACLRFPRSLASPPPSSYIRPEPIAHIRTRISSFLLLVGGGAVEKKRIAFCVIWRKLKIQRATWGVSRDWDGNGSGKNGMIAREGVRKGGRKEGEGKERRKEGRKRRKQNRSNMWQDGR